MQSLFSSPSLQRRKTNTCLKRKYRHFVWKYHCIPTFSKFCQIILHEAFKYHAILSDDLHYRNFHLSPKCLWSSLCHCDRLVRRLINMSGLLDSLLMSDIFKCLICLIIYNNNFSLIFKFNWRHYHYLKVRSLLTYPFIIFYLF